MIQGHSNRFSDELRRGRYSERYSDEEIDTPERTSYEERRRPGKPWFNHPFQQRRDYQRGIDRFSQDEDDRRRAEAEPGSYSDRDEDDWRRPGPYSGVGPRGYRRSDEKVLDEVCWRIMEHGQIDASNISVEIKDGEIILDGTVPDRRMKRLVEDVAESVHGVWDVNNQLKLV